eukprot:scaffold3774_cov18-Tisochrysis_lutea.AAC.1
MPLSVPPAGLLALVVHREARLVRSVHRVHAPSRPAMAPVLPVQADLDHYAGITSDGPNTPSSPENSEPSSRNTQLRAEQTMIEFHEAVMLQRTHKSRLSVVLPGLMRNSEHKVVGVNLSVNLPLTKDSIRFSNSNRVCQRTGGGGYRTGWL